MNFFNQNNFGQNENRANGYYPKDINFEEKAEKDENLTDFVNFQQDFSYLDPKNNVFQSNAAENGENDNSSFANSAENAEKTYKNTEKSNIFAQNFAQKENLSQQTGAFDNFQQNDSAQNSSKSDFDPKNAKNFQKNASKIENLLNLLNSASSGDFLTSAMKSGMFGNQNPVFAQALSKILTQKESAPPQKKHLSPSDHFEDV